MISEPTILENLQQDGIDVKQQRVKLTAQRDNLTHKKTSKTAKTFFLTHQSQMKHCQPYRHRTSEQLSHYYQTKESTEMINNTAKHHNQTVSPNSELYVPEYSLVVANTPQKLSTKIASLNVPQIVTEKPALSPYERHQSPQKHVHIDGSDRHQTHTDNLVQISELVKRRFFEIVGVSGQKRQPSLLHGTIQNGIESPEENIRDHGRRKHGISESPLFQARSD